MKTHAEVLSEAGAIPTQINEALGEAIGLIDSARPLFAANPNLQRALALATKATHANSRLGAALKALEAWNVQTPAPPTTPPTVPPAPPPIIGDVGGGGTRQPWHVLSIIEMNDADWLYAANVQGAQSKIWGPQNDINININAYARLGGWKYAQLFPDPKKQYDANTYSGKLRT